MNDKARKGRAWIWIGHVRGEDGEPAARFTIDERRYDDRDTALAEVQAAGQELRRRGMSTEFETVLVRPDEPGAHLPTWPDYRRTLPEPGGEGS